MYVLLALSVIAGGVAIERAINFRLRHVSSYALQKNVEELWNAGDFEALKSLCKSNGSVLADVFLSVVQCRERPYEEVVTVAGNVATTAMKQHLHRVYPLSIVATLSPLIGLLGTVIGMIEAFFAIAQTNTEGGQALMAVGIAKALSTTAAGLMVGIPALALRHWFTMRIHRASTQLEKTVSSLMQGWFAERWASRAH